MEQSSHEIGYIYLNHMKLVSICTTYHQRSHSELILNLLVLHQN